MGRRRSRWQESEEFDVPQTPLIDIIFILIIFFLVTTTFLSEERDLEIELPEGSEGSEIVQEQRRFVINVREGGVLVVKNEIVSMEELESRLKEFSESDAPAGDVEIRGDANAKHGRIMAVMNMCKRLGVASYSLTQRIVTQEE
jgi:biopolymer transport protein ExbD